MTWQANDVDHHEDDLLYVRRPCICLASVASVASWGLRGSTHIHVLTTLQRLQTGGHLLPVQEGLKTTRKDKVKVKLPTREELTKLRYYSGDQGIQIPVLCTWGGR